MDRRAFLCGLTLGTFAAPLQIEAQQAGQPRQVGFLHIGSPEPFSPLLLAFKERMGELGYVRGKDLVIVSRFADGPADLPRFAEELVRLKVDLLLVQSNIVAEFGDGKPKSIGVTTLD